MFVVRGGRRRAWLAVAVGLAALAVAPVAGSTAQSSGGASVQSEGWWNAGTQPLDVPATPLGAVAPPVTPPAPDVPEGSVPVTMRLGQPIRIGAIGIVLDAPKGSIANSLVLRLKEAGSGQQGSSPGVRACPITDFLVPEENGRSANVPEADCDAASADGERAEDGTWTFDLTAIAALWLDPNSVIQASGIRLDPVGEPPATFQVAFTGVEDAVLEADIAAGADAGGDPFATGGSSFDSGSFSSGSSDSSFDSGSVGSVGSGTTDFATPSAEAPTVPSAAAAPTAPAPERRTLPAATTASRAGKTFGNWPLSVALLLAAALALALAMGVTLGPAGRERPDLGRRQGGVSRALGSRFSTTSTRRA